ncbi:MAG: hypothetical protein ACOYN0_05690 [Phycisphaerales bacterium]
MLFGTANAKCATCGYELDFSKHDELCPECGSPVLQSYSARGLAEVPAGALRTWRLGLLLRACSFWSTVVILADIATRPPGPAMATPPPPPVYEMIWPPIACALGICGAWGGVLLTTGASALDYNPRWRRWRKATRALMIIEALILVNAAAAALLNASGPPWPWAVAVAGMSVGTTAVARLGTLLCFVGNRRRGELASRLLFIAVLPTLMIGLFLSASPIVSGWRSEGSRELLGLLFVTLLGAQPLLRTLAFCELHDVLALAGRKSESQSV